MSNIRNKWSLLYRIPWFESKTKVQGKLAESAVELWKQFTKYEYASSVA